jgi:hypothetical protein
MKASQIINQLQDLIDIHGDLNVVIIIDDKSTSPDYICVRYRDYREDINWEIRDWEHSGKDNKQIEQEVFADCQFQKGIEKNTINKNIVISGD